MTYNAQLWIKPDAPSRQLKHRPREDFGVEHAFYCSASNRRQYIFPLFKLPDAAVRLLQQMLKSDTDYGHVLLPSDPEDTLLAALKAIKMTAHLRAAFQGRVDRS